MQYDELLSNTDHRCLWIDLTFTNAFGHTMPDILRPHMREIICKDPRGTKNYQQHLKLLYETKKNLLNRARSLAKNTSYPLPKCLQEEYETLDALQCLCAQKAELKCRKLNTGQVAYSPKINSAWHKIATWCLILKRVKNEKVSSRLLSQSIKKAGIDSNWRQC